MALQTKRNDILSFIFYIHTKKLHSIATSSMNFHFKDLNDEPSCSMKSLKKVINKYLGENEGEA